MRTSPLRVAVLSWRDSTHPEGGGAERYLERIASDLAADGCQVTVYCARHRQAPATDHRLGVRFRFGGGRFGVYPAALLRLWLARWSRRNRPDVVLDVHNGVPFFARLVAGCPVVVLVHHVHREQWRVVFGRRLAAIGWWLESRVSPRLHRGCQYIAVSTVTRRELIELGVRPDDVAVVHNGGTEPPRGTPVPRDPAPSLVVLGRLVPHKRVEHAMDVVAALRAELPGLTLRVIGEGWWRQQLERHAQALGIEQLVRFEGFVPEARKEELLARSWLMLAPSVKEGWGLMVMDAAAHAVPSIAYEDAGGLSESIVHGSSGLLVQDRAELIAATRRLLNDHELRTSLGRSARVAATRYSWRTASTSVLQLLSRAAAGLDPTDAVDPTGSPVTVDLTRGPVILDATGGPGTIDLTGGPGTVDLTDRVLDLRDDADRARQNGAPES
jgi:glycosyltransferase involved in cell wall biosynthesis